MIGHRPCPGWGRFVKSSRALLLALIAVGISWISATPAHAQLAAGCTCPTGTIPVSGKTCGILGGPTVPAICTTRNAINQSVGQIAASQQQQSFWGVQMMLQQRRDQLQGTSGGRATSSGISGYSSSDFDTDALAYSDQSQKTNPLASPVYKAAPQPTPASPAWGTWVQGLGNWERDNPLSANDIGRFTSTYAVQAGLDRTWQGLTSTDDALVVGVVSSWTNSHVTYDNTPTTLRLVGPGVGVYAMYLKGGFSTDLTTKFDFLQMLQDYAGVAPNALVGITNAGVSGNVQYKFTWAKNNFLEPTAGFSFTRTMFGGGSPGLDLQDSSTLRFQAGARLGTTWEVNGISIDSSLKALVYGNALVSGTSIAASVLGAAITPTDQGLVRGELDPSMCFNLANGYSVTLSGSVFFGQAVLGGSAALNLRKQW
jgi:Autotransporter beta-domain